LFSLANQIIFPKQKLVAERQMEDLRDNPIKLDPLFIDTEELVPRLEVVHNLERISHYPRALSGMRYFERIQSAMHSIPSEFHLYALALFANVIYLPRPLLRDSLRYLLREAARRLEVQPEDVTNNSLVLELDVSDLSYAFIQANHIQGRLDKSKFPGFGTVGSFIQALLGLLDQNSPTTLEQRASILNAIKKKYWILLVDFALSGTSLSSEIRKILSIFSKLRPHLPVPHLVVLTQVLTVDAEKVVEQVLGDYEETFTHVRAIYLGEDLKINSPRCRLFCVPETLLGIQNLCEWFAQNTFFAKDPDLERTKERSGDDMRFGFKAGGWPLVTPNCPSNSVPLLWYVSPTNDYIGPFPRVSSRIDQSKSRDSENLKILMDNWERILERLV
jgi:hypothetical protein